MKTYGDISQEHRELVAELTTLEQWFNEFGNTIPKESSAMGLVAMAHDYYGMEMEEQGDKLLYRAHDQCKDYFRNQIYDHMKRNPDFNYLVQALKKSLGIELMKSFGFKP